jgi:hypothetical protein
VKVRINIDRLVLDGFSRQDAEVFAQGLEQELSRLVRKNGIGSVSGADTLKVGNVLVKQDSKPDLPGVVARSIYWSLVRT